MFLWALPAVPPPPALLLPSTWLPSLSHCNSTCCFPPPPQLCLSSPARHQHSSGRSVGTVSDTSQSYKPAWRPSLKTAFLPHSPCRAAPTSLQGEVEESSKQHHECWRGVIPFTCFVKFNLLVWVNLQHSEDNGVTVRLKCGL